MIVRQGQEVALTETELREVRASAAELMADESNDLAIALIGATSYEEISDKVKDYMHEWAAAFRAGHEIR